MHLITAETHMDRPNIYLIVGRQYFPNLDKHTALLIHISLDSHMDLYSSVHIQTSCSKLQEKRQQETMKMLLMIKTKI